MNCKTLKIIFLACLGLSFSAGAQTPGETQPPASPFPSIEKPARTFEFETNPQGSEERKHSILQLIEGKNQIRIEFEGRGLKKGSYQILKTSDCKSLERKLKSKKSPASAEEVFSFQTDSGEISTEGRISDRNMASLELDNQTLALVKISKSQSAVVACSK